MTIPRCSPAENAAVLRIIEAVTEATGVDETALTSAVRTDRIAIARRVAMAAIRAHTTLSLHETGDLFRKDHSTVVCACRAVRADLESGGRMAVLFRAVTENLKKPAEFQQAHAKAREALSQTTP